MLCPLISLLSYRYLCRLDFAIRVLCLHDIDTIRQVKLEAANTGLHVLHQRAAQVVDTDVLQRRCRSYHHAVARKCIDLDIACVEDFISCRRTGTEEITSAGISLDGQRHTLADRRLCPLFRIVERSAAKVLQSLERERDLYG